MITASSKYQYLEKAPAGAKPVVVITLGGTHEVAQEDILEPGEANLVRPSDFADVSSGDYSFVLNTDHGKYNPNRPSDFVFGSDVWFRKDVKVELGYATGPGVPPAADRVTVFEGFVDQWVVNEVKDPEADGPYEGVIAEITARDRLSCLAERFIGRPTDEGLPAPSVYGKVFWDAEDMRDLRLWDYPDRQADFDAGDFSEVDAVTENGGGSVDLITADPYTGEYAVKCMVAAAADDAYMEMDYGSLIDDSLFTFYIKFVTIPDAAVDCNILFARVMNPSAIIYLGSSYAGNMKIWNGSWDDTDWYYTENVGQWHRVTIGYSKPAAGNQILKVWVDGDKVYDKTAAFTMQARYFYCGLYVNVATAEQWEVHFDHLMLDDEYYSLGNYLPGGSYESIDRVWDEGRVIPQQRPTYAYWQPTVKYWRDWWKKHNGRLCPWDNFDIYAAYGMIDFVNKTSPPSGAFMIEATKGGVDHPADIVKAVLTEGKLGPNLDESSFDAVKAAEPDIRVGAWFEDVSLAEAVSEINKRCLYDIFERSAGITLSRYTGEAPASSVITLDRSNCSSFEQEFDTSDIKSVVSAKWGFQSKYSDLYYRVEDDDMIYYVGENPAEIDFSYGQEVMTDDRALAEAKVELLMKRVHGPRETVYATGDLALARVELGDGVEVSNPRLNEEDLIYEVFEKTVSLTDRTVTLTLVRFLGETTPWIHTGQKLLVSDTEYLLTDGTNKLLVN